MDIATLTEQLSIWGANRIAVIPVTELVFDAEFRKACEVNSCGIYGRCWMCPPDVGEIHTLIKQAMRYQNALVYQTVSPLEDSYDIEGMQLAAKRHVQPDHIRIHVNCPYDFRTFFVQIPQNIFAHFTASILNHTNFFTVHDYYLFPF